MQVTVYVPYITIFGTSTQKDSADDPRQVTGYLINFATLHPGGGILALICKMENTWNIYITKYVIIECIDLQYKKDVNFLHDVEAINGC